METEIGPKLREARIRRHIDLIEIEQKTKIRVRYLRALETEEWDILPGPTYTRSFIRTYASFLGLDGERLADDFRRMQDEAMIVEGGGRDPRPLPARPARPIRADTGPRLSGGMIAAGAAAILIAAMVAIIVTVDNGDSSPAKQQARTPGKQGKAHKAVPANRSGVSIRVTAKSEVWVCAVAANGKPVVDGQILQAGASEGPFRSGKFDLAFGNGGVALKVNGKPVKVQDTPSPVGYEVTKKGTRVLAPGTRPDCT
jgi:cytoskeleton protein RodZ